MNIFHRLLRRITTETRLFFPVKKTEPIKSLTVSLTSYPARLKNLHLVIRSLLHQSVAPENIILYLDAGTKNSDIPISLKKMCRYNFIIKTGYENLKPHTKYFYAMQEFPQNIIITVDDDLLYDKHFIKDLLNSYKKYPDCISARRVHRMTSSNGIINQYNKWNWEFSKITEPSFALCATGVGGVLYPPGIMPKETFDIDSITKFCLHTDDIWLKFMELKNNVKVVFTNSKVIHPLTLRKTQTSTLMAVNTGNESRNDINIKAMQEFTGINLSDYAIEEKR